MDVREDSKELRSRNNRAVRANAPLAANFEDCLQAFDRLRATIYSSKKDLEDEHNLGEDCYSRLRTWGHDSGASSRALDHRLRKSPQLGTSTLDLLAELQSILQEGEQHFLQKAPARLTQEIGIQDDRVPGIDIRQYLEDALEIIDCLLDLLPSLRDPADQDHFDTTASGEDAAEDIKMAKILFPKAPIPLNERLGRANWKRRQNLKKVRQGSSPSEITKSMRGANQERKEATKAHKQHKTHAKTFAKYSRRAASRGTSDAGMSITSSNVETIFSRTTFFDGHSVTSIAESEEPHKIHLLTPPMPPAPLIPGSYFSCPYCRLEISVGDEVTTDQDWVDHVYLDLEPYLCTFDNCIRADKVFGVKEDWFQHELYCHRIQKVWFCRMPFCKNLEFPDRAPFEHHLQSAHKDLFASNHLPILIKNCERYSEVPLPQQICVLCGSTCSDVQSLEHHMAIHMEQLALTAIADGNSSEDEEISDGDGDLTPEKSPADFLLDEFLWAGKVEAFLGKQTEVDPATDLPSIPTIWTNAPPRNANFVGRTDNLETIQTSLASQGQIFAVSGRGGIGKTSTIIEYAYRFEENYAYIFWVEAETAGGRADTYSLIASTLKLGGDIIQDQDGLTILVMEFLQSTDKKWLLVFDNTEEWSDISNYIPPNLSKTRGSILITTRKPKFLRSARDHHLEMDTFTLEESRQLLLCSLQPSLDPHKLRTHPEYHLAATASKLVDRLPLAISMIAGYVQVSRCTLSEFLEIWDERQSRSRKTTKQLENSAIDTLWDIGIRELSLPARNLLEILVFLDAESIPKDLLVGDHKEPFLEFLNSSETIRYRRMIAELNGRRLVHVKEQDGRQRISIHRLLQEKILQDLKIEKLTDVFGKAYCLVRKRFPPASPIQVPEPDKGPACKEYIPHVLSLRRAFNEITGLEPSFNLAQLFYDAGFHVWERQTAPDEGILYLETAEMILNRLNYDSNAKIRADIHTVIAMLYSIIGIRFGTQNLQRRRDALTIRRKVHELHPEDLESDVLLTNAASDLGYYLFETWDYEEADKIYQDCYKKYCEWGTENDLPFEYSKHCYNNARLCMHRGSYSEAINLFRKGMELSERALGKTWFYWDLQFALACTMLQSGEAQSALEIHLKGFSEQEKALGKYDSATMMSNYAVGAAERMEECIQLASVAKWSEEALARNRFHLSRIYAVQGIRQEEARKLEEQAIIVLGKYAVPDYLRGVEDKMMLFDNLQPAVGGRFTSTGLLSYMQTRALKA
ncbi:hypothetical protein BGZ57DRAFT_777998 [Hyaloscypha finlandica]|nr:hypothetical protein BGZ57DRAFT_777998 [Hyaloscypha finlandica]